MKAKDFFILLLITQLTCTTGFSQKVPSYFSNISENNSVQNNAILLKSSNSLVNINQLYKENTVNLVVLNQVGLHNVADVSQSQLTSQTVSQLGNSNYYSFKDFYNNSPINFSVLQLGNSNSLHIYGTNSLVNGMKIVQKSNFKNIVIKNYK